MHQGSYFENQFYCVRRSALESRILEPQTRRNIRELAKSGVKLLYKTDGKETNFVSSYLEDQEVKCQRNRNCIVYD